MKTIYVDGYCFGNPGPCGCKGIMDDKIIFNYNLGIGTNNVAEFYAIAAAIKFTKDNELKSVTIFSDSQTAIYWINGKYANSKSKNENLQKALKYMLNVDMKGIKLKKWDTRLNGEIPADFGNKITK